MRVCMYLIGSENLRAFFITFFKGAFRETALITTGLLGYSGMTSVLYLSCCF